MLSSRNSFKAGFFDGMLDKEERVTEFTVIETEDGTVPDCHIKHYRDGVFFGHKLRELDDNEKYRKVTLDDMPKLQ